MTPVTGARARAVIAVVAFVAGLGSMAQTLVVPLLGDLPGLLGADAAGVAWTVTAALLVGAVTSPVVGRLADLHGKRRLLLLTLVLSGVGAVLCATAGSLLPMVAGRALQGLGMGLVPLGISLLRDVVTPDRVGAAIALTSSVVGVGGAFGLPFAATVAQLGHWRWVFWGVAALTALGAVLAAWLVPPAPGLAAGAFDVVGALTLTGGLTGLLLAITRGGRWGWTAAGVAAVLLVLWVAWERRVASPLVDLRVTTRRPVLLTNAAAVVVGFAMYAQTLAVPQLLQLPAATGHGLGLSMLRTGWLMLPAGVAMMGAAAGSARLSAARGPKASLALGAVLMALGYVICLALPGSAAGLVLGTVVTNAGLGLAYGAIPALIVAAVPPSATGAATGVNTLLRSVGTTVAGAVVGVVLTGMSTPVGGVPVPTRSAFATVLAMGVLGSLIALATALAVPGRTRRHTHS